MFTGVSKVDLEYKLLLGEALILSIVLCLLPLWAYLVPRKLFMFVTVNSLVLMFISLLAGWDSKRKDVILFSPLFVLLQTLDLVILLRSFWKIVVCGRQEHAWNMVARY